MYKQKCRRVGVKIIPYFRIKSACSMRNFLQQNEFVFTLYYNLLYTANEVFI